MFCITRKKGMKLWIKMKATNAKLLFLIGIFTLLLPLLGCRQSHTVQIQVFITTKSGENMKLGAVPIMMVDETTFQKYVAIYNDLSVKQTQLYWTTKGRMEKEIAENRPLYAGIKADLIGTVIDWESNRVEMFHDDVLRNATVRTDPEGCLSFRCDKSGTYYVWAKAERYLLDGTRETYLWLIKINVNSDIRLQLDNYNMFDIDIQGKQMGFNPWPSLPDYPELH
jgi:hypothetical protein